VTDGQGRDTLRKRFIWSVLSDRKAILLDELRWLVLRREARARGTKLKAVTVSQATSFARTVRDHMPDLRTWDIAMGEGDRAPIGLVAATAVFRVRDLAKLDPFLSGSSPTVVCRYVTDLPVQEFGETPRYRHSNFAVPYYHLYLVDLHSGTSRVARIKIPPSHKVTIVGAADRWTYDEVLASQSWQVVSQD
jgi:hypothetical protein